MDTFQSARLSGMFVTLPSASSRATIQLIDRLVVMRLAMFRSGYEFADGVAMLPFARGVCTQIVDQGYAVHGMNNALKA